MRPLFLFGTLQHRPLLEVVLGSCGHVALQPARLSDHRVCSAADGSYPVIIADDGAVANGIIAHGLTAKDLDLLDFYEGIFGYALEPVVLADGQRAEAYFPPKGTVTSEGPWDVNVWAKTWGEISVISAREIMGYRGCKSQDQIAFMFPMIRARAWSEVNARHSRHGNMTLRGKVEVSARRRPYAHYFALDEFDLRHERFDGSMSPQLDRAVFRAPDVAQVLPYDPYRDCVLLVEQMRMGPLARGDARLWQLEPIAGRLDAGEHPIAAVRREAREEAGLELGELFPVSETYCSPGTSSEFYYIYVGLADLPETAAGLGGLLEEHEDIRSHILSFDQLIDLCDSQQVANAPLVMSGYWLARHRGRLREQAGIR